MEHHLRRCRGLRERWSTGDKIYCNGRITRETPFIKYCMTADNNPLVNWVPETPCLGTIRITNKYALLGMRL
jgi:hypothetical protein